MKLLPLPKVRKRVASEESTIPVELYRRDPAHWIDLVLGGYIHRLLVVDENNNVLFSHSDQYYEIRGGEDE